MRDLNVNRGTGSYREAGRSTPVLYVNVEESIRIPIRNPNRIRHLDLRSHKKLKHMHLRIHCGERLESTNDARRLVLYM